MGYITIYRSLINRQYQDIERYQRIVDKAYFAHCLFTAAQSAALNGVDIAELQRVLTRYLGDVYAERLKTYMEGVEI